MPPLRKIQALFLIFLFILSCSAPVLRSDRPKGVYHRVKKGETLWSIARAYNIDIQELAEVNNIVEPASIEADSVIFIPGAEQPIDIPARETRNAVREAPKKKDLVPGSAVEQKRPPLKEPKQAGRSAAAVPQSADRDASEQRTAEQKKILFDKSRFIWPIRGPIASKFGIQPAGLKNNGIKIAAPEGTAVVAAAAGEVTYSDTLKYYGETVILRHDDHFSTVYSALKNRMVKVGDHVRKGDRIALLGRPEHGNGHPCLNFEIRYMNKPRNPLFFLP